MNLRLEHDGLAIAVTAPEDDARWLAGFLSPAFSIASGREAAPEVTFGPLATTAAIADDDRAPIAFALDSGPLRLAGARTATGWRLRSPRGSAQFDITHGGRCTTIGFAAGGRLDARFHLMRVVREYAHNHSLATGGLMLHAAALVVGGAAIAIAGVRGAGKTTALLRLLCDIDSGWLANDRLLLRLTDRVCARAVPTVVSLRRGTRALLPALLPRLAAARDFRMLPDEPATGETRSRSEADEIWHLAPATIAAAIGRPLHAEAPIAAVVVLDSFENRGLRRLAPGEATAEITRLLLGRSADGMPAFASEVFVMPGFATPDEHTLAERSRALADRVACFAAGNDLTARDIHTVISAA